MEGKHARFQVAIKAKAKHGMIFRYMQEHSLNIDEMSALIGISKGLLQNIINFKWVPNDRFAHSKATAEKLCRFFDCTIDEFLPPSVVDAIKNDEKIRDLLQKEVVTYKEPEIEFLPYNKIPEIPYEQDYDTTKDTAESIEKAMNTLTPREQNLLRAYYMEESTMEEVAKKFNISDGRVQQIKDKALRKLRHPSRLRHIEHLRHPHATLHKCYDCDRQHLLKREVRFLRIDYDLYWENRRALPKEISITICDKCRTRYPHARFTEEYTSPNPDDKPATEEKT